MAGTKRKVTRCVDEDVLRAARGRAAQTDKRDSEVVEAALRAYLGFEMDPDFAVGFGVSREEGGIAIGHAGASEGYRCEFVAVPHLGEGVVVMTNFDAGDALASAVIDAVVGELGWPWAGWSTPFRMVLVALVGLVALAGLSRWLVMRTWRPRVQAWITAGRLRSPRRALHRRAAPVCPRR